MLPSIASSIVRKLLVLLSMALLAACGGNSQEPQPIEAPVVEWFRASNAVTTNWDRPEFSWKIRNDDARVHTCRLFIEGDTTPRALINDCTSASTASFSLLPDVRNRIIMLVNDDRGGRTRVDLQVLTGSAQRFYSGESGIVYPLGSLPASAIQGMSVNTTADTPDQLQGDGKCADALGACSLRAAIMEANRACDAVKRTMRCDISIPAGLYALTSTASLMEEDGISGDLNVHGWISLKGAGRGQTVLDGNAGILGDRLLRVQAKAMLSVSDLDLKNTRVTLEGRGAVRSGGAVYNEGELELERVGISDTAVTLGGSGGAIAHVGRRLFMRDVRISKGEARRGGGIYVADGSMPAWLERVGITDSKADEGGGLYVDGQLHAEALVVEANSARAGGGLYVDRGRSARLYAGSVSRNRISGTGTGGGIHNQGLLFLQNVSVLDNRQTTASSGLVGGAGIYDLALVELAFVTVADNVLINTGAGEVQGVGLFVTDRPNNSSGDATRIRGSVFAGNLAGNGAESNCRAAGTALRSDGGNALSSSTGCVFTAGADDAVVSLQALDLGAMQTDASFGSFRAPGSFSTVSRRVAAEVCTGIDGDRLTKDQRATQRATGRCASGAIEAPGGA